MRQKVKVSQTHPCRDFYDLGYKHGIQDGRRGNVIDIDFGPDVRKNPKRKRPLNSWQKFVKANSKKRKFRFKDGKLKLKSMGIAYRKTAAYKRSKK